MKKYSVERKEALLRRMMPPENMAVSEFQKMSRALDSCPLCHHEDTNQPPLAPVVALGTRVFLTLATEPEVSPGGADPGCSPIACASEATVRSIASAGPLQPCPASVASTAPSRKRA